MDRSISGSLLLMLVLILRTSSGEVASEFDNENIVPDIVDQAPCRIIQVNYDGIPIYLGSELTPTETQQTPEIHYKYKPDTLYTLIFTDPDTPTFSWWDREFRHWIVGNIPGDDIAQGEVIAEYVGPAPFMGTGKHRYTFLLFEQDDYIVFDETKLSKRNALPRANFSVRKFADKYNLRGPVAGNFMKVKFDKNVPLYLMRMGLNHNTLIDAIKAYEVFIPK